MKYSFKTLPSSERAKHFHVKSEDHKHETVFNIPCDLIKIWGNPLQPELREFMIAYVKKNGWSKEPVNISTEKSPRSLYKYTASLTASGKKSK